RPEGWVARAATFSGGYGGGAPPVPIPNTAVKPSSADGTASSRRGRVGRCRILAGGPMTNVVGPPCFLRGTHPATAQRDRLRVGTRLERVADQPIDCTCRTRRHHYTSPRSEREIAATPRATRRRLALGRGAPSDDGCCGRVVAGVGFEPTTFG